MLKATLRLDILLQSRNRLYPIGIGVAVLLGALLRALVPPQHLDQGVVLCFALGIGGTTFMFGASMVLLEKTEQTLDVLRTTPLSSDTYLASKTLTLTGFALVESAVIFFVSGAPVPEAPLLLILGVVALGAMSTALGVGLASGHEAITRFLLPDGALVAMLLQLPVLGLLGVGPTWLWWLAPSQPALLWMQDSYRSNALGSILLVSLAALGMVLLCGFFARARLRRHLRLGGDA